jgi:hypothetical protein
MQITLKLGFGGLCLFVPEYSGSQLVKMHVLLPNSVPSGHNHEAVLMWGTGAVSSSQRIAIENTRLDLTDLNSTTRLTHVQSDLADLEGACTVPKELLEDGYRGDKLSGRITFSAGRASVASCGRGARWEFRKQARPLAIRVVWTMQVEVPGGDPKLVFRRWDSNGNPLPGVELSPMGNELEAWIFHAPYIPGTLPPKTIETTIKPSAVARHFHIFGDILDCGGGTLPLPHFSARPDHLPSDTCWETTTLKAMDGLDLMCIAATAPIGP